MVAVYSLLLSSVYNASVFSDINPVPLYFFHLRSFLWKELMTDKVRKTIIDQNLGYISFSFEVRAHLDNLFAKLLK